MKYLFNALKMFRLSSTIREQCYLILFLSVSIKIIEQDKFYTPVIEYFSNVKSKSSFKHKQYFWRI